MTHKEISPQPSSQTTYDAIMAKHYLDAVQPLLLPPNVAELSPQEQEWVKVAIQNFNNDEFYRKGANFAESVHAEFIGFYLNRKERTAIPVYRTDNGLCTVSHNKIEGSVSSLSVTQSEVYLVDFLPPAVLSAEV